MSCYEVPYKTRKLDQDSEIFGARGMQTTPETNDFNVAS